MESIPKKELVRLVATDGQPVFDLTGKANGRGIYLCLQEECFNKAIKKRAISRGLDTGTLEEEKIEVLKSEFAKIIAGGEVTE